MESAFLVPEQTVHANGESQSAEVSDARTLLVTLGITGVVEQEFLLVALQGSKDASDWSAAPLLSFPQKFYTGVSSILLNLEANPDVKYIRAQWKIKRWGRGDQTPSFTFYLFIEPVG